MPDFRGADTKGPAKLKNKSVQLVRQKMSRFVQSRKAAAATKKVKQLTLKQRRLANKYSILATDNTIQGGLGLSGLSIFKVDQPVGALPYGQRRFYAPFKASAYMKIYKCKKYKSGLLQRPLLVQTLFRSLNMSHPENIGLYSMRAYVHMYGRT